MQSAHVSYLSAMARDQHFPRYGYLGVLLILVFWYVNWYGEGLRTHWAFFPLWVGYILCVDALAVMQGRRSLITTRIQWFIMLFLISIPVWWLFEWINKRAQYWIYIPEDSFSPLAHTLWSTLCFSTVVPAIFVTANALLSVRVLKRHYLRLRAAQSHTGRRNYMMVGILMLIALFIWPQYGMAFLWVSLFFIMCPVNVALGRPSLMGFTAQGDWRLVIVFSLSALICGFFWEMWNMYSWPKWIYTFPYLNSFEAFEMPLAGYLGYLPFGLEVWAFTTFLAPRFTESFVREL